MPIFPKYSTPQADIPTVRMSVAPADTTFADIFSGVSKIGQHAASAFGEVALKKQKIDDASEMATRVMRGELDMDSTLDGIRRAADTHAQAPEAFQSQIAKLSESWTAGLRPEQAAMLQKELTPRYITALRQARELKDKYRVDNFKATYDVATQSFVDRASRLDVSDTDAFADASLLQTFLDQGVQTGLVSRDAAVKDHQKVLDSAAYARLQRMTVSDNPQRALDVLDAEDRSNGSTFAKLIAPKERNALRGDALGKVHALKLQARQDDDYVRAAQERTVKELRESTENMFEQQLDAAELRVSDVESAASLQLLTSEKQRYFKKAIENRNIEGKDDPATYRALSARYVDINESPAQVQADVERAYADGRLSRTTMVQMKAHLQSWQQAVKNQGRAEARQDYSEHRADSKDLATKRHGAVEQILRDSLVSGESSIMKELAEPVLAAAREELGKTSIAMNPNGVDPFDWLDKNKNRFLSIAGSGGQRALVARRNLLPPQYQQVQHVDELKADPAFMALPAAQKEKLYYDVRDLLQLQQSLEKFKVGGNSSSPQSTPGAPQGEKKKPSLLPQ